MVLETKIQICPLLPSRSTKLKPTAIFRTAPKTEN
jgi:hypothetical protein